MGREDSQGCNPSSPREPLSVAHRAWHSADLRRVAREERLTKRITAVALTMQPTPHRDHARNASPSDCAPYFQNSVHITGCTHNARDNLRAETGARFARHLARCCGPE